MSNGLHRLVYHSRTCMLGPSDEVALAIRSILEVSRINNGQVDVTGALMFNQGCFAQVLEGPRDAVEATFERIQQDERHGSIMLLAFDPVPSRGFPNWSMAYVGAKREDAAAYAGLAAETGFDLSRMRSEDVYRVLTARVLDDEPMDA